MTIRDLGVSSVERIDEYDHTSVDLYTDPTGSTQV